MIIFMIKLKVRHFQSSIHIDPNDKHFMTEVDLFVVGDRHIALTSICEGDNTRDNIEKCEKPFWSKMAFV